MSQVSGRAFTAWSWPISLRNGCFPLLFGDPALSEPRPIASPGLPLAGLNRTPTRVRAHARETHKRHPLGRRRLRGEDARGARGLEALTKNRRRESQGGRRIAGNVVSAEEGPAVFGEGGGASLAPCNCLNDTHSLRASVHPSPMASSRRAQQARRPGRLKDARRCSNITCDAWATDCKSDGLCLRWFESNRAHTYSFRNSCRFRSCGGFCSGPTALRSVSAAK
jgi:hypothetical protein